MRINLSAIAQQFSAGETIAAIKPLGQGLINDTYQVNTPSRNFVLQRLNPHVFPHPEHIMANLQILSQHIQQLSPTSVRLQIPAVILTNQLQSYFQDDAQDYWRALALIQPAESRERLNNQHEAEQVGFALGHFHWLCSELSINSLFDTLPGFHITPDYYQQYLSLPNTANTPEIRFCRQFIHGFQAKINCLEHPKQQGQLKQRVIHGDPKLNNFLFKPTTDQIISLIDLDTVKPGLLHYDIGDCLRSCCHTTPSNQFDLDCCASILKSYLAETKSLFSHADYRYLYAAIQLIPFELGLRFFSDYLAGNQYFKVAQPEQNLYRALDLFQLTKHIEQKHLAIEKLIVGYQNSYLQQN